MTQPRRARARRDRGGAAGSQPGGSASNCRSASIATARRRSSGRRRGRRRARCRPTPAPRCPARSPSRIHENAQVTRRATRRTISAAPIAARKPHMSSQNGRNRVFQTACSGHCTKNTPKQPAISSTTSVERRRYQPAATIATPGEHPDPPRQPERRREQRARRRRDRGDDAPHDPFDRVLHRVGQEHPVRKLEAAPGREDLGVPHALRVRLLPEQRQRPHRGERQADGADRDRDRPRAPRPAHQPEQQSPRPPRRSRRRCAT